MTRWRFEEAPVERGLELRLVEDDAPMSYRAMFAGWTSDDAFSDWYATALASTPFDAFFWEHPALTRERLDHDAELVLVEAPALARLAADRAPFAANLVNDASVVDFENLSGDAHLVVPCPRPDRPDDVYAHLAAFLRGAPAEQRRALFARVAEALDAAIGDVPRWLSTAGMGVAWLHMRIDERPKYYRHRPYRV